MYQKYSKQFIALFFMAISASGQVFAADNVKIESISPDPSKTLYVGDKVDIEVKVNYTLDESSATVSLLVQDSDDKPVASTLKIISKGNGPVVLKKSFIVPETNAIQIFTPLLVEGDSATSNVVLRSYKVENKQQIR